MCHRTVNSTCPVHQGTQTQTRHLREFPGRLGYNSPDCPVYTGQCPVRQGRSASGTRQLRETPTASPLKFTGLSGVHRTVRCASEATVISAPTALCRAFNARRCQARPLRHTGQGTVHVRCACPVCTGHPGGPTSQKLQRLESNGSDDVAGGTGLSGVHRTVRCAIEQTASQRPLLVVGGYKYPNHPTIHCIQVFHFSTTTRALGIQF